MLRSSLLINDSQAAALHLWVISAAQVQYFKGDKSAVGFGERIPIAREASADIEAGAIALARPPLTEAQFEQAQAAIQESVSTNLNRAGLEYSPDQDHSWTKTASEILLKPLDMLQAPLSSLDPTSSISDTAVVLQRFTDEFACMRLDLEAMPSQVRWNTQLLALELERSVNGSALALAMTQVGNSAESLAATARSLPADLRAQVEDLAADLQAQQAVLAAALKDTNATLDNVQTSAAALDNLGQTWIRLFAAFSEMVAKLQAGPTGAAPTDAGSQSPPFDINDYTRTTEKLTESAEALSALLQGVHQLTDAQSPPALLLESEQSARALIDRIFLGAAALVVFTALVALAYRGLVGRRVAA